MSDSGNSSVELEASVSESVSVPDEEDVGTVGGPAAPAESLEAPAIFVNDSGQGSVGLKASSSVGAIAATTAPAMYMSDSSHASVELEGSVSGDAIATDSGDVAPP